MGDVSPDSAFGILGMLMAGLLFVGGWWLTNNEKMLRALAEGITTLRESIDTLNRTTEELVKLREAVERANGEEADEKSTVAAGG